MRIACSPTTHLFHLCLLPADYTAAAYPILLITTYPWLPSACWPPLYFRPTSLLLLILTAHYRLHLYFHRITDFIWLLDDRLHLYHLFLTWWLSLLTTYRCLPPTYQGEHSPSPRVGGPWAPKGMGGCLPLAPSLAIDKGGKKANRAQ
jgi:hypothetical protein